ncbi:CDP-alcohol phosphatidyltransferase family protein [Klebsiella aerogenes]|uniref:CDP-alcohol phosphatidyltransferase family protein n=1 Tax=Klebsiella aerogenes TaxID=548 RepID=UPI0023B8F4DF|nr:CDP-alcohol phosphatidyltransferase family protein [Klebsiella aerogenes]ELA1887241.1 CDP-alcohol phosphatidyltransferase family protein [Klebsiella aerogenes]MDF0547305.1 CDP-alcohol phosphatidyltransferase family protein [Klebsiella aerogenes]
MTLYRMKPAFQTLLRPLMFWLAKRAVTANQVTLAAIALSFLSGALLALYPHPSLFWLLPVVLFIRMALNALDGMLARECCQQSRLGAVLNEFGDVLSDIALYLPFALLPDSHPALVLAMLLCAVLSEFAGVLAQAIGGLRSYAGPMGKSDRALVFGGWGLALSLWPGVAVWCDMLWSIITLLLIWTIINRCAGILPGERA